MLVRHALPICILVIIALTLATCAATVRADIPPSLQFLGGPIQYTAPNGEARTYFAYGLTASGTPHLRMRVPTTQLFGVSGWDGWRIREDAAGRYLDLSTNAPLPDGYRAFLLYFNGAPPAEQVTWEIVPDVRGTILSVGMRRVYLPLVMR